MMSQPVLSGISDNGDTQLRSRSRSDLLDWSSYPAGIALFQALSQSRASPLPSFEGVSASSLLHRLQPHVGPHLDLRCLPCLGVFDLCSP